MKAYWVWPIILIAFLACLAFAQEWSWMTLILWENPPPNVYPGYFSPSYAQAESLLYCDAYCRLVPEEGAVIYSTHLDSVDYTNSLWWSDPIPLPQPINIQASRNAMPAVNHAGDSLFFCSDREGTRGGLDIWLSIKSDGIWGEPINLGDSVNSEADELGPCYSPETAALFMDREDGFHAGQIYQCQSMGDNAWGSAILLPEIINVPGMHCYDAYFDDDEMALYFTYDNAQSNPDPILKSLYIDGEWGYPVELEENVNGFYQYVPCNLVTTEGASLSRDHNLLFYSKQLWERTSCIDFYSYLFYSQVQGVGIDGNEENPVSDGIALNIYPNPSNSNFVFELDGPPSEYSIAIYNIRGQLVDSFDVYESPFSWSCEDYAGRHSSTGIYFAVVTTGAVELIRKLVLIK